MVISLGEVQIACHSYVWNFYVADSNLNNDYQIAGKVVILQLSLSEMSPFSHCHCHALLKYTMVLPFWY